MYFTLAVSAATAVSCCAARGYVLDHGDASPMFAIVRRRAAERSLSSPQADAHAVWALATLAALLSGDWLNARG